MRTEEDKNLLILGPEDVIIYVPSIFWDGIYEDASEKEILYIFCSIIHNNIVQIYYSNYKNIIFNDEELGKTLIIKGKYILEDKKKNIKYNRFEIMDI